MKIGLTINNYYKSYLEEIALLNGVSVTTACSLILENFLSYNLSTKRVPLFQKKIVVVFSKKTDKGQVLVKDESHETEANIENWDEMCKALEVNSVKDVDLDDPFSPDSED